MIKIENYSKVIKEKKVLDEINVTFKRGYIHGVVGRNGSGKTMLFRAICGLIKPSAGQVYIDSQQLHKELLVPKSLGVIIENVGLWPYYTGYENLKMLSKIKNVIDDDTIKNTMVRVGLDPKDNRTYKKYSLGMRQRLGIAQAIMEGPSLLILDEPTNGLDEEGVGMVRKLLLEEKDKGTTILIASHNAQDIAILADYVYTMRHGRLYNESETS